MPCALEVIDTRVQSTSHIQCNRSFDRNIASHFSKGHLIHKPVSVRPENGNTALSILPLGHDSDWKPAPILSDFQEVNKVISLTSADQGIEGLELLSAQPRILCCSGQPNERNMHDQADPSKPVSNGNPYGRSTSSQSRQRKSICNLSIAVPPCHVVAKKFSWPATTTMRSGSDILHDGDKPLKKSSRKKGNRKGKEYGRMTRKKLNLSSEITFEENTSGVSPVEVLPPNLLVDKLSEITPCASSVVKEAHLGGEKNNDYVSCGTLLNLSTLGTDEMDGSECAGSSNDAAGGRLSCSCVPYLNDESNTTDSSEFDGSTFTEHGMGEESKSYQMLPCACVYNPDCATTDSFLSKWNNGNSGNYRVNVEARLTMKDENSHDHSQLAATTGLNDARKCQLIGSQLSATHAEDTNDHLEGRSSSSKDVTDSCNHTERVQCSSEACSSNPSLQISSGRSRRSRKTPSYSDLTASNRVMSANRHKNNGKDSLAVWQKVERNDKIISKTGHSSNPSIQDKSAHENSNKGVHEDPTRNRAKHKLNRKVCKQESPNETVELATKEEDALDSCQTFSRPIYKNQTPLLRQQRSSSSKQGSQPSKNYYAPRNSIPKVPKDSLQQEELSTLQHDTNTSDKSASNSCSADEFVLTGGGSNHPTKGNERSQSVIDIASLTSCNLASDLMLQAASEDAHISDPHCLCPEDKGVYTSWSSKSLCTDPCTAETEEARCVKLTTENNSQESCKWYSATGHLSQKWVPVGKKDASNVIHLGVSEASVVEDTDTPANGITDSVGPVSTNGEDRKLASEMTSKLNSAEHDDLKCQSYNGIATDYTKIKEAISYVHTAQQQTEDIQLLIGRPLADFEQFVYSASPVVHCKPCPAGCKSYLQECARNGLCFHQTPDITLSSVWQWYEEPGCYGLEVKAQDFRRSKGLWKSHCQFTKYFIPYLSAVQLFRQTKRTSGGSSVKETTDRDMTCETSQCQNVPPIFAKLMPQQSNPKNRSSTLHTEDDHQSANGELIFEFFESEQPYSRRQLFDKRLAALPARVTELIAGVRTVNCQTFGDPKSLELSLHDLHPASWYCVAWYPIYSIPDGKLQSAFLTYHSLGHWISRNSSADEAVALPVIGLQSYNDKAERWFEMSKSDSEDGEPAEWQCSEASQVLKQRSRTMNEAAAVMSRANVVKNGQMSRNRHPDYEFFLSRYR